MVRFMVGVRTCTILEAGTTASSLSITAFRAAHWVLLIFGAVPKFRE